MALYAVDLTRSSLTTTEAMGQIQATLTNPRRLAPQQAYFGCLTSGADETFATLLGFITAGAPTGGTAVVPAPTQGDPASFFDGTEGAITVDSTQGNDLARIPHHRRSTPTWSADPGKEPISPATDNNGFGIYTPTAPTVAAGLTWSFTSVNEL